MTTDVWETPEFEPLKIMIVNWVFQQKREKGDS